MKYGRSHRCKVCTKITAVSDPEYGRQYRKNNKDKIRELNRAYVIKNPAKVQEWAKKSQEKNKEQNLASGRRSYQKNKDKILAKHKEYREAHKEEGKEYQKAYYQKNKPRIYARENKRLKEDPQARLSRALRARLREAIKVLGGKKFTSALDLVSCTIEELREHMEIHFQEGMSWDNYGEWHIDHIKPCCSFDLTEETQQRECFHYTNLQPLWAKDNLEKGSRNET